MSEKWTVTSEEHFPAGDNPMGNRFYGYRKVGLDLPQDRKAVYNGLLIGDIVHVVATESDLTTYFVRQHRPNLLRSTDTDVPVTVELPGGFAEMGDPTESGPMKEKRRRESARNELREEIGRSAQTLKKVGALYTSPGVSDEQDHIYRATRLSAARTAGPQEDTEIGMDIIAVPFGQAYDQMRSGKMIVAASTLGAMAMVERTL